MHAVRLYPTPQIEQPINGLHLQTDLRDELVPARPFTYTNFVTSLDGRIAVQDPASGRWGIPHPIRTAQDRRLYHELAAQADVIIITSRHARGMLHNDDLLPFPYLTPLADCDLKQWRLAHGRSEVPALAIVSIGLDFSAGSLREKLGCAIHCITDGQPASRAIAQLQAEEVEVTVANEGKLVEGAALVKVLAARKLTLQYSVAGPGIMNALLKDRVLNQLYITQVDSLAGGRQFRTFCEIDFTRPQVTPRLRALYRFEHDMQPKQNFFTYDMAYAD